MTGSAGPGRRALLALGAAAAVAGLSACGHGEESAAAEAAVVPERKDGAELSWKEARDRLEEGNHRFVSGEAAHPDASAARRKRLAADGQKPFAVVVSCADSRVPPEVAFDQGLGDLFVVRAAGEVLDNAVLGSVQYAVHEMEPPLLVVLGHTKCGAVKATIEALEKKSPATGTSLDYLVSSIAPVVREAEEMGVKKTDMLAAVVEMQVEHVVKQLEEAKICNVAVKSRKLKILGAVYDLATGEIAFQ